MILAHYEDIHTSAWESFWHNLETWQTGGPFFILLLPALTVIIYLLARKSLAVTLTIAAGLLFALGILSFMHAPTISAVAFSAGMALLVANVGMLLLRPSTASPAGTTPDETSALPPADNPVTITKPAQPKSSVKTVNKTSHTTKSASKSGKQKGKS